jgi:sugar phosphate isomerase/epimerase
MGYEFCYERREEGRDMKVYGLRSLAVLLALGGTVQASPKHATDPVAENSQRAPRLWLVQNIWGMEGLATNGKAWSVDDKLQRLTEAGFDALDVYAGGMNSDAEIDEWRERAKRAGLKLGAAVTIRKPADIDVQLARAQRTGSPYVDVNIPVYAMPDADAVRLVEKISRRCKQLKLTMALQTHRGHVTQDLRRAVALVTAVPSLSLNLDLSHYFVAGELRLPLIPEVQAWFKTLSEHAIMFDGRVSNGEQIQIDLLAPGEASLPYVEAFRHLWRDAMVVWLARAKAGDIFPVRLELGPPAARYAQIDAKGDELSDRWQQTLALRALLVSAWNEAVALAKKGERRGN